MVKRGFLEKSRRVILCIEKKFVFLWSEKNKLNTNRTMENVIVGFDFSSGSAYAVDLAIDVANRLKRDLRLVYVKAPTDDEAKIREEIERRNAAVAHLLKGIKMDYVIREGKVAYEIADQAKIDQASMVIVGTHGMSGFERNWIGKNTYRTIVESPSPVLSVREDFNFNKSLDNIVVPIDSSADTRQKVGIAMQMAKTFGSTIHLLGLYTSTSTDIHNLVNSYLSQVEKLLTKNDIKHTIKTLDAQKNLTITTLEYAAEVKADLIVIMTEQEKAFSDWLIGNYAQQMLRLSNVPILSVRPEQLCPNV